MQKFWLDAWVGRGGVGMGCGGDGIWVVRWVRGGGGRVGCGLG
jgi:hypothetical protein